MNTEAKKKLQWWLLNGVWWGLAALGLAGFGWAYNVFLVVTVVLSLLTFALAVVYTLLSIFAHGEPAEAYRASRELYEERDHKIPQKRLPNWLTISTDCLLAIAISAGGWVWLGLLVFLQMLAEQWVWTTADSYRNEARKYAASHGLRTDYLE